MSVDESQRQPAEMLTVEQVARLLQVSSDTVYRLAGRGELPGRKVGHLWRFSEEKVRAWIESRHVCEARPNASGEDTAEARSEDEQSVAGGDVP